MFFFFILSVVLSRILKIGLGDVEKWDQFEFETDGPSESTSPGMNPFVDVTFGAFFQHEDEKTLFNVRGFYDGDGKYRVRFMPNLEGKWNFTTYSDNKSLRDHKGDFNVIQPSANNRGQAKVFNDQSFRWENGDEYFSVGTTTYSWVHQDENFTERTLQTLLKWNSTFNKIRYCVFPLHGTYTETDPPFYPYEGTPPNKWEFDRFHPPFWRNFEKKIKAVQDLGYITDLILFHPYDQKYWGFSVMEPKFDELYVRYVLARFSSFRSIWWSMANEWDHPGWNKTIEEWHSLFSILQNEDPYQHERSIHNQYEYYDYNVSAITHHSLQIQHGASVEQLDYVKTHYTKKPYCIDEMQYEGDIPERWGRITARDMVRRFWHFAVNLAQAGHGETVLYEVEKGKVLWHGRGYELRGDSPPRIRFYRDYFENSLPVTWEELESVKLAVDTYALRNVNLEKSFYLMFWNDTITTVKVDLSHLYDEYEVTFIEHYEMTKTVLKTVPWGEFIFTPPTVPYLLDVRGK